MPALSKTRLQISHGVVNIYVYAETLLCEGCKIHHLNVFVRTWEEISDHAGEHIARGQFVSPDFFEILARVDPSLWRENFAEAGRNPDQWQSRKLEAAPRDRDYYEPEAASKKPEERFSKTVSYETVETSPGVFEVVETETKS